LFTISLARYSGFDEAALVSAARKIGRLFDHQKRT
jgi:hypothetical protein